MHRHAHREVVLATGLAGVAGFVDAVGFLSIGGYFVSFMSGNTTRAGAALPTGQWGQFGLAAVLIGSFIVGVIGGTLAADAVSAILRQVTVLGLVSLMLLMSAIAHDVPAVSAASVPLLAAAMGAENAVFARDGEVSIGLTYMTGTLVKLGQRLAAVLRGSRSRAWLRYLSLWASLSAGAVSGSFAYAWIGFTSMWLPVAGLTVACALALIHLRRGETSSGQL